MFWPKRSNRKWQGYWNPSANALPQLIGLGIASGLGAALLVVPFRPLVEGSQTVMLGVAEDFESLSMSGRFLLLFLGALLLGCILVLIDRRNPSVGVFHVLERLRNHQGRLRFCGRHSRLQHAHGRCHLRHGSDIDGIHYRRFHAGDHCLGIGLHSQPAGVRFRNFFQVPPVELNLLWEIPFVVLAGLTYALAAALFIRLHLFASRWREAPVFPRYLAIGLLTGSVAMFLPQILGPGYDPLYELIAGNIPLQLLVAIVIAKLVVTAIVTGLGMVAMLGAVLNAPMAALVTILELSHNPAIIFPSMLMVVVACAGVQQLFKVQDIFAEQLKLRGIKSHEEPARQFLSRIGVGSVMNSSIICLPGQISHGEALDIVNGSAVWIVVEEEKLQPRLIGTADLAKQLENTSSGSGRIEDGGDNKDKGAEQKIDLTRIAARVFETTVLDFNSNLYEASQKIQTDGVEALCITRRYGAAYSIVGVLTRDAIQKFYGI